MISRYPPDFWRSNLKLNEQVVVTDVTVGGFTVTMRESQTPDGFFIKSDPEISEGKQNGIGNGMEEGHNCDGINGINENGMESEKKSVEIKD